LGRPRPKIGAADGLYGPSFNWRYASFPSGHSSVAFGTAGALLATLPPVGVPVFVVAGGVGWSRLYNGAHYPSDVWAGAWIGLLNGLVFAAAARRLMRPVVQP
jgi:undecaprenyl-diphosphatase